MDYSLLIGVVRRKFGVVDLHAGTNQRNVDPDSLGQDDSGAFHAATVEGPGSYHMGIIDILQQWNFEKKTERFIKTYIKWQDPDGLSAIRPDLYQERFMSRAVYDVFDGLANEDKSSLSSDEVSDMSAAQTSPSSLVGKKTKNSIDSRFSVTPITNTNSPSSPIGSNEVMSPLAAAEEGQSISKGNIQNGEIANTKRKLSIYSQL